jgi:Domain of unknown function (DUF4160)
VVDKWCVLVPETLAVELSESFRKGPIVDDQGRRLLSELKVAGFDGFKVEIFADEHPPPHFRVSHAGETANFSITDCKKLNGGLHRYDRNIRTWHAANRAILIERWNTHRPTDCTVGPVKL